MIKFLKKKSFSSLSINSEIHYLIYEFLTVIFS